MKYKGRTEINYDSNADTAKTTAATTVTTRKRPIWTAKETSESLVTLT